MYLYIKWWIIYNNNLFIYLFIYFKYIIFYVYLFIYINYDIVINVLIYCDNFTAASQPRERRYDIAKPA